MSNNKNSLNEEKAERGRKLKAKYEYHKQILLELEKKNYDHVFLLKTTDGWNKILSHSAVLFKYYISPIAKERVEGFSKPPRILADSDFRDKAPIGVMWISKPEMTKEILKKCGAVQDNGIADVDGDWITAYILDRTMTEKEFWSMEKEEQELWDKANRLIIPKAAYPNLGIDIQEATKLIYDAIRKQNKDITELVGKDVMSLLRRLYTGLILAEKGRADQQTYFRTAASIVAEIDAIIIMISTMKLIESNVVIRMAEAVNRVDIDIENAWKNYQKKNRQKKSQNTSRQTIIMPIGSSTG